MNKFDFLILLLPFLTTLIYVLTFFISQFLKRNSYLSNLLYSFVLILVIKIILVFIFKDLIEIKEFIYIFFAYLCMSFVFMNLIQVPISSLQVKILRIIKKNNGLKDSKIYNIYNANHIFEERFNTLLKNKTIKKDKALIRINNKKILLFYYLIKYIKIIHNIKL